MSYKHDMPEPDLTLIREFKRRVFIAGDPTLEDQRALSDIGFDLMLEHGQHVQTVAIDAARSPERSYFVSNVLKDGLAA